MKNGVILNKLPVKTVVYLLNMPVSMAVQAPGLLPFILVRSWN